jgi:hypothetical protein
VRRDAAVAGPGQRGVRTPLSVGEEGGASAGEVTGAVVRARKGGVRLLLRELAVRLDVDLPPGEARGEAGVEPLLADRERELVVGTTTVASRLSSSM